MNLTYLWPWNTVKVITLYEWLDPEQGYNDAKFQRPLLDVVCQKAVIYGFALSENVSVVSLEYVQKWKIIVCLLSTWFRNPTKFQPNG